MTGERAARRRCDCERAKAVHRDSDSLARGYDEWTRIAGIVIGLAFGAMFAIGILMG